MRTRRTLESGWWELRERRPPPGPSYSTLPGATARFSGFKSHPVPPELCRRKERPREGAPPLPGAGGAVPSGAGGESEAEVFRQDRQVERAHRVVAIEIGGGIEVGLRNGRVPGPGQEVEIRCVDP